MNCLKTLAEAAKALPLDSPLRARLTAIRLALMVAIRELFQDPTVENMIELNALWAQAKRVLDEVRDPGPTRGLSGSGTPENVWTEEPAEAVGFA